MGQHTGQHDRRQADCGDNANPIKNVSEPLQHVRDASMPGGGTAPLQLPGTANIGMPRTVAVGSSMLSPPVTALSATSGEWLVVLEN
jgi:hypothetical protein